MMHSWKFRFNVFKGVNQISSAKLVAAYDLIAKKNAERHRLIPLADTMFRGKILNVTSKREPHSSEIFPVGFRPSAKAKRVIGIEKNTNTRGCKRPKAPGETGLHQTSESLDNDLLIGSFDETV